MSSAIGWNNRFQNAAGISQSFGGNYTSLAIDPAYPLINLVNPDPQKFARWNFTRNATNPGYVLPIVRFSTVVGTDKTCRVFGVMNCRLPASVTNVNLNVYDYALSGVTAASYIANCEPIPGTTDRYNIWAVNAAGISTGAIGLAVYCPPSITDYLEYGLPWASDGLILTDGIDADWEQGYVDPSEVDYARMSNPAISQLPRLRTLEGSMSGRTYAEMIGNYQSLTAQSYRKFAIECGKSSHAVIVPRYGTTAETQHNMQALGVYGLIQNMPAAKHRGGNYVETSKLSIREIR
jgi:hypothetical protein